MNKKNIFWFIIVMISFLIGLFWIGPCICNANFQISREMSNGFLDSADNSPAGVCPCPNGSSVPGANVDSALDYLYDHSHLQNLSWSASGHYITDDTWVYYDTANTKGIRYNSSGYIEINEDTVFSGFIRIGNTSDTTSGNIRWDGSNFQGYNGSGWINLDTISVGSLSTDDVPRWNGSLLVSGLIQDDGSNTITFGTGAAGVDYQVVFDGEDNDGIITWKEDEDRFEITCGLKVIESTSSVDILNGTYGIAITDGTRTAQIISANFGANYTGGGLFATILDTTSGIAGAFSDGTFAASLGDGAAAGGFSDPTNYVDVCNGTNALDIYGSIKHASILGTITSSGTNSTALGYAVNAGGTLLASGDGSLINGYATGSSGGATIQATSLGSRAGGYAGAYDTASYITASDHGSFAYGKVAGETDNAIIQATSDGSIALGYAFNEVTGIPPIAPAVTITSSGFGSLAGGYCHAETLEVPTSITSSGIGSFAWGYADNGALAATGTASFALGEDVQAGANNAYVFGKNFTNNTADSFAIGFGQIDFQLDSTESVFYPLTKFDGKKILQSAHLQTIGAGTSTLKAITLELNNTYKFKIDVVAEQSDNSNHAGYTIIATAYRDGSGATVMLPLLSLENETNGSWAAQFVASGNDVQVNVTGVAGATIEWGCSVECVNISS